MDIHAPTGEDFEKQVFGFTRDQVRQKVHVENRKDIAAVRKIQHLFNWDPRNPKTRAAKALYDRVRSKMGPDKDRVLMCWSIGTALDSDHGTDCFFVCKGATVTVDLTISPRGKQHAKAKVVLTLADFQTNRHYQVADLIAKHLQAA